MSPIDLLKSHKSTRDFAAALRAKQSAMQPNHQMRGQINGIDATTALVSVSLDDGGMVMAQSNTNGYLAAGGTVIVTQAGSGYWIDAMPQ